MVAKVISGKNIRGLLHYNENKVSEGVAQCIAASRFGCEPKDLTFSDKLNRFRKVMLLNPKVKTNAIHISLNFDISEKLSEEQLVRITSDYMTRIGFGDQPYLVYRHTDAAHQHVHVVTTNIKTNGQRIDIHNIGRGPSETARKEIELAYGLVRAEGRRSPQLLDDSSMLVKATYGRSETKRSISNIVRGVTRSYKCTSLPELNAVLRQFNVIADRGKEGTHMFAHRGLLYSLLDKNGKKVGVPIKASSIYGKPTLPNLEKQFRLNEVLRRPFREKLKAVIDQALKEPASRNEFTRRLEKAGVIVLFRENEEGRVYGATFIDNRNKVVFNGSVLGKAYSAHALLQQFKTAEDSSPSLSGLPHRIDQSWSQPAVDIAPGLSQLATELTTAQAMGFSGQPYGARKRRKKRKKGHSR